MDAIHPFVLPRECVNLPVPLRVAWAATCVERALALYSSYFKATYLAHDVFDFAWKYASGSHDDRDARHDLIQRVGSSVSAAEREGYFRWCVLILGEILAEIDCNDGLQACDAVEMGGDVFAIGIWFGQSSDPLRLRLPGDDFTALMNRFASFSREVFQAAAGLTTPSIVRGMFDAIPLQYTYEKVKDAKSTFRKNFDFPAHERPMALTQQLADSANRPKQKLPVRITRAWLAKISAEWQLNPPATEADIEAAQVKLDLSFPKEYVAFLRASNGMKFFDLDDPPPDPGEAFSQLGPVAALLLPDCRLFDVDKVVQVNRLLDSCQKPPGCLVIGRHGDEGPIFLHLAKGDAKRAPVYQQQDEDFGIDPDFGIHRLYGRKAKSLTEWLAAGCPLPEAKDADDQE